MQLDQALLTLLQVTALLFVIGSMLAMGLSLTVPAILRSLGDRRLLGLALLANFVLVPALAWGAAQLISDDHVGLQTGLILIGAVAGAPFLPKLAEMARGDAALSVGLMVVLMVVTIPYAPLVLPLLLGDVTVDAVQIATSLVVLMLLPLGLGLFVRARYRGASDTIRPIAAQVSSVALALLAVGALVVNFDELVSTVGTGGLVAALLLLVGAVAIGLALGGRGDGTRSVVALGTGQRNLSAALVIAAQNFGDDPEVITMVMVVAVLGLLLLFAAAGEFRRRATRAAPATTTDPDEARRVAEQAYVFAFPMLEFHRTMLAMSLRDDLPTYRGPLNTLWHEDELLDHTFTTVVTPNTDTLYSMAFLDLRAEPMLLTLPPVAADRYVSFQLTDQYTHNIGYVGTRATGNEGGTFMIAGPGWDDGITPAGLAGVFRSESDFLFVLGRTQVDGSADLPAARRLMDEYALEPLSGHLPGYTPPAAPALRPSDVPLPEPDRAASVAFIGQLNWLLGHVAPHPADATLLEWFSRIGVVPGAPFDPGDLTEDTRTAIEQGIRDARVRIDAAATDVGERRDGWQVSLDAFGNRRRMQDRWLERAAAAAVGLFGNDAEEAVYPMTRIDGEGRPLDGGRFDYEVRLPAPPPVRGFWSVTVYRLPERLFVPNEARRYSVGDRTADLRQAIDGSIIIRLGTAPPSGSDVNWLPAPHGPFFLVMRLYIPEDAVLDGSWSPPPVDRVIDLAESDRTRTRPLLRGGGHGEP